MGVLCNQSAFNASSYLRRFFRNKRSAVSVGVLYLLFSSLIYSSVVHINSNGKNVIIITDIDVEQVIHKLPEIYTLPDPDNSLYFTPREGEPIGCYTTGSYSHEAGMPWACLCRKGYYGPNCAIPEVVMTSVCVQSSSYCSSLKARSRPRRIIHFMNVHHEIDHVEIQLGELGDVVDVFVLGESDRTTSGSPNQLRLLPKMRNEGLFKEYHHKIIHVTIPSTEFPHDPAGGGWMTDAFIRNYIGAEGLLRIDGIRDDDLIVLTDTDEFLNKDVLLFLKVHDGFPEPVSVNFRESEFGFFWRRKLWDEGNGYKHFDHKKDPVACTVAMLRQVYDNLIMSLRREWLVPGKSADLFRKKIAEKKLEYSRNRKNNVSRDNLAIGRFETSVAAFHCTWCFRPEGIREKWMAANREELADWGPNKEKLELGYIKKAIAKGNLFGQPESGLYMAKPEFENDTNFAPGYVWKHKEKFAFLLYPDDEIYSVSSP